MYLQTRSRSRKVEAAWLTTLQVVYLGILLYLSIVFYYYYFSVMHNLISLISLHRLCLIGLASNLVPEIANRHVKVKSPQLWSMLYSSEPKSGNIENLSTSPTLLLPMGKATRQKRCCSSLQVAEYSTTDIITGLDQCITVQLIFTRIQCQFLHRVD